MAAMSAQILPAGVFVQTGEPPSEPIDYESNFVLPEHTTKPLQLVNAHPLDNNLRFFEKPHVYTFHDVPTTASVTYLAHQFERPFDGTNAIRGMKGGKKQAWPRKEYAVDVQPLQGRHLTEGRGAMAVSNGRTISVCQPYSIDKSADVVKFMETARVKGGRLT